MKLFCIAFAVFLTALLPSIAIAQTSGDQPKCEIGPISRTYGSTEWLVFGCDDGRSLVIATAAGNPASPFYFTFFPDNGHYRLHGEGTGSRDEAAAAFREIESLSQQDIAALLNATKISAASK